MPNGSPCWLVVGPRRSCAADVDPWAAASPAGGRSGSGQQQQQQRLSTQGGYTQKHSGLKVRAAGSGRLAGSGGWGWQTRRGPAGGGPACLALTTLQGVRTS
jgi:hypothetical protein